MKYETGDIRRVVDRLISYFRKQEEIPTDEEIDDLWNRIEHSIRAGQRRHRIYVWSSVSAAALLAGCIWLGTGFFREKHTDFSVVASRLMDRTVETDEIQLIVAPAKKLHVKDGGTVTYAQDGGIRVDRDSITSGEAHDNPYDQFIVPKGRFGRLILSDGSELYVNSDTKVVYPKQFGKKRREIFVDGEIYIDVERNEKVPFVVKTAKFDVEVLGTAFDVKAYSDCKDGGEIVLLRGQVNVKSHAGKETVLNPDHKAVVQAGGAIRTMAVEAADYILWTKGVWPLNNGTVGDVLNELSRYYHVKITCDETIRGIRLAGKIDLRQGVEKALHNLSVTGGFVCRKEGDTYVLQRSED